MQRGAAMLCTHPTDTGFLHNSETMAIPSYDPGLGQKFSGNLQRIIDENGNFTLVRKGVPFAAFNPYIYLINTTWGKFFLIISSGFLAINALYALVYFVTGTENLSGAENGSALQSYLSAFYFSVHTFTTVGYGNMAPKSMGMNFLSVTEIFVGLLYVALITGLLYGRFSRPSAKLIYSSNMLVQPYDCSSGYAFSFRTANLRHNNLMEIEADVMVMLTHEINGKTEREYKMLKLERKGIIFLPMAWTVVHPVDEMSPLLGYSLEDLLRLQAQFLILIKGYDETFSQIVHSRFTYTVHDIIWGAKFIQVYNTREDGLVEFELNKLSDYNPMNVPLPSKHLVQPVI